MEITLEGQQEGNIDSAKIREDHGKLQAAFNAKPENTLPEKEMTDFLFAQINSLGNHVETWEKMNDAQKAFVKQLKNALARKKPLADDMENKQTV